MPEPSWRMSPRAPGADATRSRRSNQRRLTFTDAREVDPSWSRDSAWISFQGLRDGNSELYMIRLGGSEELRITHDASEDGQPSWGP